MQIPTHSSRTWRLRFTVTDEPGRLAAASAALADLGINILSLEFHLVSATEVIDEAIVSLPPWLDVPTVEHALHRTGATDVWAVPIPVHQLEDIATRVLRLAAGVLASRSAGQSLCDAIADLVDAELVSDTSIDLTVAGGSGGGPMADQIVRFGREHVKRLPSIGGAWTMSVPDDPITPRRVFVAVRRSSPFTSTESARVRALLHVVAAAAQGRTAAEERGPSATDLRIAPLTPAHLEAVEELHQRCSTDSRYRRYFSSMPTVRRDIITRLLEAGHGRVALGAWLGGRLVGMGNGCPVDAAHGGTTVELAALVEDAHQGQRIGTRLMQELVRTSCRSGTSQFVVITLPDNRAMARIVRRLGQDVRTDFDPETVTFTFTGLGGVARGAVRRGPSLQ
jgi:predicted N-acetyltransferase YhbS